MTLTETRPLAPYVGPRPFARDDADRFFGRDTEISSLRALLFANRVVVLHAPSGAGKTSLVKAGLLPELERDGEFDVLPIVRVGGVSFEVDVDNPFVANTLASWPVLDIEAAGSLTDALAAQPRVSTADGLPALRLAVFDQFEELFTWYPEHWDRRRALIQEVHDALAADDRLRVLLVIRDDYLGQLDPLLGELGALSRANFHLDLLRRAAALAAVQDPLRVTDATYGEGVAEQLVDTLMRIKVQRGSETVQVPGEFVEPVQLQVVCDALWRNLPPDITTITAAHWRAFGDVDQALAEFYSSSISAVAEDSGMSVDRLHQWFEENLLTEAGTRSTVFQGETTTAGLPNGVIERLEDLHVVRGEERRGGRWFELTHDRLVTAVERTTETRTVETQERLRSRLRQVLVGAGALVLALVGIAVVIAWTAPDEAEVEARVEEELEMQNQRAAEAQGEQTVVVQANAVVIELAGVVEMYAAEEMSEDEFDAQVDRLSEEAAAIEAELRSEPSPTRDSAAVALQEAVTAAQSIQGLSELPTTGGAPEEQLQNALETARTAAADSAAAVSDANEAAAAAVAVDSGAGYDDSLFGQRVEVERIEAETAFGVDGDYFEAGDRAQVGNFEFEGLTPAATYEVWGLVDTQGSADSNSVFVVVDRTYLVQNVEVGDVLNVRAAAGIYEERIGAFEPGDEVTAVVRDGKPTVERVGDVDWYEVELPEEKRLSGFEDRTTGWVHASFIGWETWDMFETEASPPSGFTWDRMSTRCRASDTFNVHSCAPRLVMADEDGTVTVTIRSREPGTRIDALSLTEPG